MPVDLVPLTSVYDILLSLCEMQKLRHFSPWIFHFFTDRQTSYSYTDPLKVVPEGSMVEYLSVQSRYIVAYCNFTNTARP